MSAWGESWGVAWGESWGDGGFVPTYREVVRLSSPLTLTVDLAAYLA